MKILAVYCSKGGVGKTATAVNISYTASKNGKRVLLCDLDPQGASSYYFRIRAKNKFNSQKLFSGKLAKYIRGTDYPDLDLLPAHFSHRNIDLLLYKEQENLPSLRDRFDMFRDDYDLVILDCPPNLTLLSENILLAADMVITPVIPTTLSILSLEQLLKLCKKISVSKKKIHAFFSMAERRKTMHITVIGKYRKYGIFMKTIISYMAEIEKMGLTRRPVGSDGNRSRALLSYEKLWEEIEKRGGLS